MLKYDDWIKTITILIDTREQKFSHITDIFNSLKVSWKRNLLDIGDYTFIYNDIQEKENIVIERKNSLTEISGNLAQNRDRFKREFEKLTEKGICHLLIENGSLDQILKNQYITKLHPNAFIGSLLCFQYAYNLKIHFIQDIALTGEYILKLFYYYYYMKNKI